MTSISASPKVWADRACANTDLGVFFPSSLLQVHAAQRICASCPFLTECAEAAERLEWVDCVVASVWMQNPQRKKSILDRTRKELAQVAATGEPAPLCEPLQGPKDCSQRWSDPKLQEQVVELRTAGMAWDRIAVRVGHSGLTARKAYAAATGIQPTQRVLRENAPLKTKMRRRAATAGHYETAPVAPSTVKAAHARTDRKYFRDSDFQDRVVQLRIGGERTWRQIAAELGCSTQTARAAFLQVLPQGVAS
ncbi:WhiB family transcriptional regulator [Nocardia sp. NBC_01388]|uniref:WhiB family transcriptional regulator n=1 Tax=Nocardia sp. NBC_01388 TaxID=2903596 RepID=UPI002F91506B